MGEMISEEAFLCKLSQGELCADEILHHIGRSYAIDRAIAASPLAKPDVLKALAESHDQQTRRNTVCNVGCPAEALISLAQEFSAEFFAHPLLDLMILEDPMLLTRLNPGVLKSFLNDPECPESFVLWACRHGHKTDQLEILKRSDLSVNQLRYIVRGSHPKAAERAIDRLIEMGESW
jgi:hypothetical protein